MSSLELLVQLGINTTTDISREFSRVQVIDICTLISAGIYQWCQPSAGVQRWFRQRDVKAPPEVGLTTRYPVDLKVSERSHMVELPSHRLNLKESNQLIYPGWNRLERN